jgi:transcriptional regulator with XRE-family HTH domain
MSASSGVLHPVDQSRMPDKIAQQTAAQRVNHLIALLAEKGLTQREIAERAGVPSQYLSDVKQGRRPLGELFARRLGEEFGIEYRWLLFGGGASGGSNEPSAASSHDERCLVPLLAMLPGGSPREAKGWDGSVIELFGLAAVAAQNARGPYVYRVQRNERTGRLRKGDLILVSQVVSDEPGFCVVRVSRRIVLAHTDQKQRTVDAYTGRRLPKDACVIGSCLALVWGGLGRAKK